MNRSDRNHKPVQQNSTMKIHRIKNIAATLRRMNQEEISSDVLGSYTGMTQDHETPVQDADDL